MSTARRYPLGLYALLLVFIGVCLKLKRYAAAKEAVEKVVLDNPSEAARTHEQVSRLIEGLPEVMAWDWAANACLLGALILLLIRQSWIMAARREARARRANEQRAEAKRRRQIRR